jgi:diguanylate cyclase (GGDEF)-like protein/putative nucleotidyltransferase with HDIG domain
MPWLGLIIIAPAVLRAGALFGVKRRREPGVNELDRPARERGFQAGYDEPGLAETQQDKRPAERPPKEIITHSLPGLKAHRYFVEALERQWRRSARTGSQSSLILMRLDGVKALLGHKLRPGADKAEKAVAAVIDAGSRPPNVVARYKEDEFALLVPKAGARKAEALVKALRASVRSNRFLRSHRVASCYGIATFPDHGRTMEELLRAADYEMCHTERPDEDCDEADLPSALPRDSEPGERSPAATLDTGVTRDSSFPPDTFSFYRAQFERKRLLFGLSPVFSSPVDANGGYPEGHSQKVAWLAIQIARKAGLSQEEIDAIHLGGLLHDIGKFDLPERVFRKPTRLTPEEYEIMKSHTTRGARMLESLNMKGIERIVRHHHECFDGTGYPDGLAGEAIPLGARIVAVAECFEDMVSDLGYKSPRTFEDALAELRRYAGTQFDPGVVAAFLAWADTHGDPRDR